MEPSGFELSSDFDLPKHEFWENYSDIKSHINSLKRKNASPKNYDPCELCKNIEIGILEFDDAPNLSPLQIKIRKLDAASELCRDICELQMRFKNLEMNRAVSEVLEVEKYEGIAKKIYSWNRKKKETEKNFYKQALNLIKGSLLNGDIDELEDERGDVPEHRGSSYVRQEEEGTPRDVGVAAEKNLETAETQSGDITSIVLDSSVSELGRNLRHESVIVPDVNLRMSHMNVLDSLPSETINQYGEVTEPDVGTRNMMVESESYDDINEIRRILENGIPELPLDTVVDQPSATANGEQPEGATVEGDGPHGNPEREVDPQIQPVLQVHDNNAVNLDDFHDLPPIQEIPKRKRKRRPPVFDRSTVIHQYTERARRLNRNIVVERVQVYEGPPSLLHAFTLDHVLKTPAVNNGLSTTVRSEVLEQLYSRYQLTDPMPHAEPEIAEQERKGTVAEPMQIIEEEVGLRRDPRANARSEILDVSVLESAGAPARGEVSHDRTIEERLEQLRGSPVSRVLQQVVVPPPIPPSAPWLSPRSPRIENLRGKPPEEPLGEPWFMPTKQPAPSEKWREFAFIRRRLEATWMRKEEENGEKSATLRELLEPEGDWKKENILTLLRMVDKMSLWREVVLEGSGQDIVIRPFQVPYVTPKQFSLRDKAPQF